MSEPAAVDSPALDGTVGLALVRAAREHRVRVARGLAALSLHPGQEMLLAQLWSAQQLSLTELGKRLGVEAPTVVKAVHRLEASGFVTRHRDEQDRRVWRISLTEAGRGLEGPVRAVWAEAEARMLAGLSQEYGIQALRVLQALERNLRSGRHD